MLCLSTEQAKERIKLSESDRTIESVRSSASNLLSIFKDKLQHLQGNDEITHLFIRQGYDGRKCYEEAIRFFGTNTVRYIAVDGTKFEEPCIDMFVFYAGAFAYGGTTEIP